MTTDDLYIQHWDEYFMRHVYLAACKSKDPSTKIGAVLVRDGVVISEGFNGFPRGVYDHIDEYNNRDIKYAMIVHAENNSILNAARNGISTKGSVLYTQCMPCNECAKSIIQAGVTKVVIHKLWPAMLEKWEEVFKITRYMFDSSGIKVESFNDKLGLKAMLKGEVISV